MSALDGLSLPFGVGRQKPRHFRSMAKVAWRNRNNLPWAWRILNHGVCDGCALGTSGLRDWTMTGVHLCMIRLELLELNTMGGMADAAVADVAALEGLDGQELRRLGRLTRPLLRRRDEAGFRTLSWDEALDHAAGVFRRTDPERLAFYLTSRAIPNETYYVAQKVARFLGTPHVDNSARLCHAASTVAMKQAFGYGASTASYIDWLGADLIVFFGSNAANSQPVTTKYLHLAKQKGCEVAVVNPYREPGMERYWVPSLVSSAVVGTKIGDHWFQPHTGGDLAFLNGTAKALLALPGGVDEEFVANATEGFAALRAHLEALAWADLESASGCDRAEMERFAALLVARPNAIFVWSMGLTQHAHGTDTVAALCNLGMLRGMPGRARRGLVPIRGHSGVQGGAEVGCVPTADAATFDRWERVWGFAPPRRAGLAAPRQVEAAANGELDVVWLVGGDFLGTLPDPEAARRALYRPRLRVHQDIVLNPSMLVPGSGDVLLLPAQTRYEMAGGVTETSTERRIIYSPQIGPREMGEARAEWEVLCELAARVRPELADRIRFEDTGAIRAEIAAAVPLYAGIEKLAAEGGQMQWGGSTLFADRHFATPSGKAQFACVSAPRSETAGLRLSTRRGSQFNSMVWAERDPLTGARREDVLVSLEDAGELGLEAGAAVEVRSAHGAMPARVRLAPIKPGNVEAHWPEANVLLPTRLDPRSGEPDYNVRVTLQPLDDERDPSVGAAGGGA